MTLRELALKVATTWGKDHMMALDVLRKYIKDTPPKRLKREMEAVKDDRSIKAIMEAGAKGELYDMVIKKVRK